MSNNEKAISGALLGCAVGDALGLPYEGLSRRRAARMLGEPDRYRFLFGRGMVSDDTEHSCMTAAALVASGGDPDVFAKHLARSLRYWLLPLPAGVGFATLRAVLCLWMGMGPRRSGVFSAGNGPAMRSPVIGAAVQELAQLAPLVIACTRITHTDPKAYYGAYAVALAAFLSRSGSAVEPAHYQYMVTKQLPECSEEFRVLIGQVVHAAESGLSVAEFAEQLGLEQGISGYVYHTVPMVLYCWLLFQDDYPRAVTEIIRCGGDADTTAAIVGGMVGSRVGPEGVPAGWLDNIMEYPRTIGWMQRLGHDAANALGENRPGLVPRFCLPAVVPRNLLFLAVVLFHGFRRLFPPY